jgi:DNA primase
VILVEGIFDYFAFYRLLQDQGRPVVVSTLGSYLSAEAMGIFKHWGGALYRCV